MLRIILAALMFAQPLQAHAQRCAESDSAAAQAVRSALTDWVDAANRGDRARMRNIWAPGMVGWFPLDRNSGDYRKHQSAASNSQLGVVAMPVRWPVADHPLCERAGALGNDQREKMRLRTALLHRPSTDLQ